ncbi:class I SAM-dependent methyltransferase [Nanoarchaeota archaeon]
MDKFDFNKKKFENYVVAHSYFMKRKSISIKRLLKNCKYRGGIGLDIGCGSGEMERLIFKNFKNLIGVDPALNQIKKATAKKIPNCKFLVGDSITNNFPSKFFDLVIIVNVLHHINNKSNQINLIKNCHRILKDNGTMLIYEHNPLNPLVWLKFYYYSKVDQGCTMIDPFTIKKTNKRLGFSKNKLSFLFSEGFGEYVLISKKL